MTLTTVRVESYDEQSDKFTIFLDMPEAPCAGEETQVSGVHLSMLVREWGEPAEFVGKVFSIKF